MKNKDLIIHFVPWYKKCGTKWMVPILSDLIKKSGKKTRFWNAMHEFYLKDKKNVLDILKQIFTYISENGSIESIRKQLNSLETIKLLRQCTEWEKSYFVHIFYFKEAYFYIFFILFFSLFFCDTKRGKKKFEQVCCEKLLSYYSD